MDNVSIGLNAVEMVAHSSPMAKAVLLTLLIFSVSSWAIIANKLSTLHMARKEDNKFLSAFGKNIKWSDMEKLCGELRFSPVARVFSIGYNELIFFQTLTANENNGNGKHPASAENKNHEPLLLSDLKSIGIAMDGAINTEAERLGSCLNFLATTGSATPFIGLFGTVWGIMYSLHAIGIKGSASIGNVAPGIAEALIATAAGLFVAIPAVIAYNFLNGKIQWFVTRMDNFLHNFLCQTEKKYLHRHPVASGKPQEFIQVKE